MRWKTKEATVRDKTSMNSLGDVNILKVFLLLPRHIGDEWRWMERVAIRQVWGRVWFQPPADKGWMGEDWVDTGFIDGV